MAASTDWTALPQLSSGLFLACTYMMIKSTQKLDALQSPTQGPHSMTIARPDLQLDNFYHDRWNL